LVTAEARARVTKDDPPGIEELSEVKNYGGHRGAMNPKGVNLTEVWDDIPLVRSQPGFPTLGTTVGTSPLSLSRNS